jgi:hypothetical protein
MSGRYFLVAGLLVLAVIRPTPAEPQIYRSAEERFFRIEWQLERVGGREVAIVGSLDNQYRYRLQRVQLQAQVLDDSGHITHEALAPVNDVPAGGRGSFRLQLPATGARYVVTVYAFEFGSVESP